MSTYFRGSSLQILLLSGSLCYVCSAWADSFAPESANGVLEIDVTVDGAGSEQAAPGTSWKSKRWSVKHSGTYRLAMVAGSAIIDGEESGSATEDSDDASQDAYWEKKTEACKGDPACEMNVAIEQMQSPEAQAQMQQLGEMMSAAQMGPGGPSNAQTWRIASRSGRVRMEQHEDIFGVISETGGGLVDVLCTSTTNQALSPKPSEAAGPVPATITINGNTSRYMLQLPLEDTFMLKRLCMVRGETSEDPPRSPAPLLGDRPTSASGWPSVLQIQGTYTGGPAAPVFEGRKEIQADILSAPNRKAKVTLAWRFHPSRP